MDIGSALKEGINILINAQKISPATDAGVILCYVLNCSKTHIFAHQDQRLNSKNIETYFELINKRAKGMPVQYITGQKEFMSLPFTVNSNALIPRQETEILVESVIDYAEILTLENNTQNGNNPGEKMDENRLKILDIGVGSGCIAVSLAYYIEKSHVVGTDISQEALNLAYANASLNGVSRKINLVLSNLFEKIGDRKFHIIVSNPPYIPTYEIENLQQEVRAHEPILALNGGKDGLYYYRRIIKKSPDFLNKGGLLAFEVGKGQAYQVADLMKRRFNKIEIREDLAKINRVVIGII